MEGVINDFNQIAKLKQSNEPHMHEMNRLQQADRGMAFTGVPPNCMVCHIALAAQGTEQIYILRNVSCCAYELEKVPYNLLNENKKTLCIKKHFV